jgi:hypothetical protein
MTEERSAYHATPNEIKELAPRVLAILKTRIGRGMAITARFIAIELGLYGKYDDRRIRMIIRYLVVDCHETIAASHSSPRGYWWIGDEGEARAYLTELKRRNLGIWERYRSFSKAAHQKYGIPVEQLRLEI